MGERQSFFLYTLLSKWHLGTEISLPEEEKV
jgi:hypothetical protein